MRESKRCVNIHHRSKEASYGGGHGRCDIFAIIWVPLSNGIGPVPTELEPLVSALLRKAASLETMSRAARFRSEPWL